MDDQPTVARFVPDRRYTLAAGLGTLVALVAFVLADDGPGRLIAGLVVLVLLAYAIGDLVFSPRLVASTDAVVIRSPLVRASLRWDEIETVRADVRARYGLRSTTLEIDAGETLVVLSRRALGREPAEAADLITSFRPR